MKVSLAILSIIGWFTLVTQLYVNIATHAVPLAETITRYFSYFTLLTNGMVTVCCTVLWLAPASRWGRFFTLPQTVTAIAVYIAIVGIIYNIALRSLWHMTGLQKVLNELEHVIVPALFVLYWYIFAAKEPLNWKHCWPWLIYPLVYIVVILIRGAFSGFYPYPFINVSEIGMQQALINSVVVGVVFLLVSLLFIEIAKWIAR